VPSKQELPWTWLSPAGSDKSPVFPIFGKVKELTPASVGSRGIRDRSDYSRSISKEMLVEENAS
jgi:hypothetical protein